jgi:adenine-specific DNA-methyltransferase
MAVAMVQSYQNRGRRSRRGRCAGLVWREAGASGTVWVNAGCAARESLSMDTPRLKFQELLKELFQFDCADLDFGIYRIMNQKRALIEQFIEKDLLATVGKALRSGALKEQGDLAEQLADLAGRIREDIADDAIDADGRLAEAHAKTKLGKQYRELQVKAAGATSSTELEAQVFNHLWAFFSRYYDNGDFLSTRRYSRREKYAIPYNGEEVYLHWANRDQYYIKTGETFTDYQWTAGDVTVLFKLVQAETEKDNVKSDTKRLFVPHLEDVTVEKKTVTLPFEYRGLTDQEAITYGKKNQQDAIIAAALESLPKRKALREASSVLAALMAEYRKTDKGESVSRLEHHLRRYAGKNTRDYFIHKDLEGFLTRELDFYIKNEVLALDDLAAGGAERAEGWFQLMEAIRAVGGTIIAFLAQIENFQKRIFEKRKFVTETHYCFTLDRVPKSLWPRILKNKAQIEEWKKLYSIQNLKGYSDPLKPAFLDAWPSLMVDTVFFADDVQFIDELLEAQRDFEESLGGLVVHSENFQALNVLAGRFKKGMQCIYLDPPYNTDAGPIAYKNGYRSASWVALMENRLGNLERFFGPSGILCITIDDYQVHELGLLLESTLGRANQLGVAVIRNNPSGRSTVDGFSVCHEYAFFYRALPGTRLCRLPRSEKQLERFSIEDGVHVDWRNFRKDGGAVTHRALRPKQFYPLFVNPQSKSLRIPALEWNESKREWIVLEKPSATEVAFWPRDAKGKDRVWSLNHVSAKTNLDCLEVRVADDGDFQVYRRHTPREGVMPRSWWDQKNYAAREHGSAVLADLFGDVAPFSFAKSPYAVRDCLWVSGLDAGDQAVCLDFFAGSGTTGHAVLDLNRDDDGERQYVLCEMGRYVDTVLKPRLAKVVFSRDWKEGKPVLSKNGKSSGLSHAFKYIRLESYEDALGNIAFDEPQGDLRFDDYVLRYMLEFEARGSETLLNVEKLAAPFAYRLDIMDGGERKSKPVDLPETFNYLLGLKVRSRRVHLRDGKHRYLVIRGTTNPHSDAGERDVCVIWRDVTGWKAADFKADAAFAKDEKLTDGADDVFVNADGVIPNARVLDGLFKERMFAPVNA